MVEYLINVLLGSVWGLVTILIFCIGFHFFFKMAERLHPNLHEEHKNMKRIWFRMVVPGLIAFVIGSAAMSSSITYKHETHDRQQLNNEMYQRNMNAPEIEKKDRMLKPDLTKEERAERFKELTNYK
jgi:heme/copper-type cytochrome/quinol oxidase subunit 2